MIRPYEPADLEQLLDVWYRASKVAHTFLDEEFFAAERKAIVNQYLPMAETWVYDIQGDVVGFIALVGNEVGGLFVDPALHGRGIGRSLMDHAFELRGRLDVDVFKQNHIGRRFYDRYGFQVVSERSHDQTGHILVRMEFPGSSRSGD